ncbi:hypothetical protein P3L10_003405 [Capsicum annuum]
MGSVAPGNCNNKEEKMRKISDKFDVKKDEHLGMTELLAWIMGVEPADLLRIPHFLSLYVDTYRAFLVGSKGLCYTGFTLIYVDGLCNIDRDFNILGLGKANVSALFQQVY